MASAGSFWEPARSHGNFKLVCSSRACNLIPVHKYESSLSGLTVLVGEVEGPLVVGYFCLATEPADDDGLAHTLEHLVFLGSKGFPYKGVLEVTTARSLVGRVHAWTNTTHTCFSLTAAGEDEFLGLLPVFLDHLLRPTLTDAAFAIAVHHVSNDGSDEGIVYGEQLAREALGEMLTQGALVRAAYPGDCGYGFEPGGLTENLRESTTNERVREFHTKFYRPENLTLIVSGTLTPQRIFQTLGDAEATLASPGNQDEFTRPWQFPAPPLQESRDVEVLFPCEEEDFGMVYIGWRGPSIGSELYKVQACSLLLKYLSDSPDSLLQNKFLAPEQSYAANLSYTVSENNETLLYLFFDRVPTEQLDHIPDLLKSCLQAIDTVDMKRMDTVIYRHIQEVMSELETSPHDTLASFLIVDTIFGRTEESFEQHLNSVANLRLLQGEPESFWLQLLQDYLVSAPQVTATGRASRAKQQEVVAAEMRRIVEQRRRLAEEEQKRLAAALTSAIEETTRQPPAELLASIPVQTIETVGFRVVYTYTPSCKEQHPKFNLDRVPVTMHLNHVRSNFVYICVLLDSSGISLELRTYIPLFLECLLELPVKRGEDVVSSEDVVSELERDTINTNTIIGLEAADRFSCGPFANIISVLLQVEVTKYEQSITWIRELLYQTQFTSDKLREVASRLLQEAALAKTQGQKVVTDVMKRLCFSQESNFHAGSLHRQHGFLTTLLDKLGGSSTADQVVNDMESLRAKMTTPERTVVHLAADLDRLHELHVDPASLWGQMLPEGVAPAKRCHMISPDWAMLSPPSEGALPSCVVTVCTDDEDCYLSQTVPSIQDYNDPDLPVLLLFLQYLTQLKGPLWKHILGNGVACLYQIMPRPNEGLLHMGFFWATDCLNAYKTSKSVFENLLRQESWDPEMLETARRSLISEIVQLERSVGDVVTQALLAHFKGVGPDYKRTLTTALAHVGEGELTRVARRYVAPLFDPTQTKTAVVCPRMRRDEIITELTDLGFNLIPTVG